MSDKRKPAEEQTANERVRLIGKAVDVPVYNCLVYLSRDDASGLVLARAANLADIRAEAATQREALQAVVAAFKSTIAHCAADETEIPWLDPPLAQAESEQPFYVAVHL